MKRFFSYLLVFCLSLVLTLLSFRYFVKSDKYLFSGLPKSIFLSITIDGKTRDIVHFAYSDMKVKKYTFLPKNNGEITINGLKNDILSIDINGVEIFRRSENLDMYTQKVVYPCIAGKTIVISVVSQKEIYNYKFSFGDINIIALILTFGFYFLGIKYLFMNENKLQEIKKLLFITRGNIMKCYLFDALFILVLWFVFFILGFRFYINVDYFQSFFYETDIPFVVEHIFSPVIRRFHPYFFYPFYPVLTFLNFVLDNPILVLGIIYSFIGAISCFFLSKTFNLFLKEHKVFSFILVFIYAFCFSHLFFLLFFETYIVSSFYFIIILYILAKECLACKISKKNISILIILSALSFGVSLINILYVFIPVILVFVLKKYEAKIILSYILYTLLLSIILFLFSGMISSVSSHKEHIYMLFNRKEVVSYFSTDSFSTKMNYFYKTSLLQPILAQKTIKNENFAFCVGCCSTYNFLKKSNIVTFFSTIFYLFLIFALIYLFSSKSYKKTKQMIYLKGILSLLFAYYVSVIFWSPEAGFQFANSYLFLYFIIIAMFLSQIFSTNSTKNKKIYYYIFFLLFTIYLIVLLSNNLNELDNIYKLVDKVGQLKQ